MLDRNDREFYSYLSAKHAADLSDKLIKLKTNCGRQPNQHDIFVEKEYDYKQEIKRFMENFRRQYES